MKKLEHKNVQIQQELEQMRTEYATLKMKHAALLKHQFSNDEMALTELNSDRLLQGLPYIDSPECDSANPSQ